MDYHEKVALAQAFEGKRNSDWTPIFHKFEVNGVPLEMRLVPPGGFKMGSNDYDNEKPVHPQTLTEPYWIGVHPVTNAQWRIAVEASNGKVTVPKWADWYNDNAKTNHPVVGVTWYQCIDFLNWLGAGWSLPTEMEWEFAARGLDNLVYPFGNEFKQDLVVYSTNSNKSTATVGGRPQGASWVGAQDMSGGVWEWTSSIYANYPYNADDTHENMRSTTARVLRGGSWHNLPYRARVAYRHNLMPIRRQYSVGLRCVYSPSL